MAVRKQVEQAHALVFAQISKSVHENTKTTASWRKIFDTPAWQVDFDNTANKEGDRPDLQVRFSQASSKDSHLWLEAKPTGHLSRQRDRRVACQEALGKLQAQLRTKRDLPFYLIVTDFHLTYLYRRENILTAIRQEEDKVYGGLGKPSEIIDCKNKTQFIQRLQVFWQEWESFQANPSLSREPLDVKSLTQSLVGIAKDFRVLCRSRAVSAVAERQEISAVYNKWLEFGGIITASSIDHKISKSGVGSEEIFVELSFHSMMVRLFGIKSFIDHGYLRGSQLETKWMDERDYENSQYWRELLHPQQNSDGEKVIRSIFHSGDVYLWVLDFVSVEILARIKTALDSYDLLQAEVDVLGDFYQTYMQKYAKDMQLSLGQFYTPHGLVRAMWTSVSNALASKNLSLKDKDCLIVDPCVGTGTFLTQGLRFFVDNAWTDTRRVVGTSAITEIMNRLFGFEINPLSKGVAVLNLMLESISHTKDISCCTSLSAKIYETNAYDFSKPLETPLLWKKGDLKDLPFNSWIRQMEEANQAKGHAKYRVVIANPPWNHRSSISKNKTIIQQIKTEVMPWAWNYKGEKLSDVRGCNHGLRDDYAFFLGLGMKLLGQKGVLCFVTNDSWMTSPAYRLMRKYILDNFQVHMVMRLGAYFKGVRERAVVLTIEKGQNNEVNRNQVFPLIDWSNTASNNQGRQEMEKNLDNYVRSRIDRKDISYIKATGEHCIFKAISKPSIVDRQQSILTIDDIFRSTDSGVTSGCNPLLVNAEKHVLEHRVRALLTGSHSTLVSEIVSEVKGGEKEAKKQLNQVRHKIREHKVKYDEHCFQNILMYNKQAHEGSQIIVGYAYFDPRIWMWPRVKREAVEYKNTFWSQRPKLVFRDKYDPEDKFIVAMVENTGSLVDYHIFNGGTKVASIYDSQGKTNLSRIGTTMREKLQSDDLFLYFISSILNSEVAHNWGVDNPQQPLPFPLDFDQEMALNCAKLEQEVLTSKIPRKDHPLKKSLESCVLGVYGGPSSVSKGPDEKTIRGL